VLNLLGGSTAYAHFVRDGLAEGHRPDFYPVERQPVLGNSAFATELAERAGQPTATPPRESLDRALARLADRLRIDPIDVRGPGRGRGLSASRTLLAFVLVRRLAYRLTDVAALLGRDPATVGKAVTRLAAMTERDDAVVDQVRELADCPEVKV
jgi:chromosomal replication initiation ATPase DnaA